MQTLKISAAEENKGERLDKFLRTIRIFREVMRQNCARTDLVFEEKNSF